MTDARVITLPVRPSEADVGRPNAQARARTREKTPAAAPLADGGPAGPGEGYERREATHDESPGTPRARWFQLQSGALAGLTTGASVLAARPPSLMDVWTRHMAAVRYYNSWALQAPVWCWGAIHTWLICAPLYVLAVVTDSVPKMAGTLLLAWLIPLLLFHVNLL